MQLPPLSDRNMLDRVVSDERLNLRARFVVDVPQAARLLLLAKDIVGPCKDLTRRRMREEDTAVSEGERAKVRRKSLCCLAVWNREIGLLFGCSGDVKLAGDEAVVETSGVVSNTPTSAGVFDEVFCPVSAVTVTVVGNDGRVKMLM